jgi:hypothetical protein
MDLSCDRLLMMMKLMLYKQKSLCSEIDQNHIKLRCEQNVEFLNAKPGGTLSNDGT